MFKFVVADTTATTPGMEERAYRVEIAQDCPRTAVLAALRVAAVAGGCSEDEANADWPASFVRELVAAPHGAEGVWLVSDGSGVCPLVVRV